MSYVRDLEKSPLKPGLLRSMNAYWRAANYLSVGQIYLLDNPLLTRPLTLGHIKPRLLGHWGTTPGLNFIYVHLNRIIKQRDLEMIYVAGPGHGGPGLVANVYLEGTYTEHYPDISQDEDGMRRLFKQFSFPGGIPSHVAPDTPGSIHDGASSGTRSLTPTGPHSTARSSSWRVWWAMARPRPALSRRAGIRTSSSTRLATARCCPSFI